MVSGRTVRAEACSPRNVEGSRFIRPLRKGGRSCRPSVDRIITCDKLVAKSRIVQKKIAVERHLFAVHTNSHYSTNRLALIVDLRLVRLQFPVIGSRRKDMIPHIRRETRRIIFIKTFGVREGTQQGKTKGRAQRPAQVILQYFSVELKVTVVVIGKCAIVNLRILMTAFE